MTAIAGSGELSGFPTEELRFGARLFRILRTYDADGARRSPWFFSSSGATTSGRFDLPAPQGTCYLSDRPVGSWLEVFRGTRLVARGDAEARSMLRATRSGASVRLASLVAARATRFGVRLDLSAGDDYGSSQDWALRLRAAGHDGLLAWIRHDPSATARNVALFGRSGPKTRIPGWRTVIGRLTDDTDVLEALAVFGIALHDVPYTVPITPVR